MSKNHIRNWILYFLKQISQLTPPKTNMTMENQPFDFPLSS